MTTYTIATLIGIPVTVLLVFGILIVAARPDREPNGDGVYAAYLGLASIAALYFGLIAAGSLGEAITIFLVGKDPSPGFGNSLLSLSDSQSSGANVVAFAVGTVVAAIVYGFHSRRRHELIESCHDRVLMPVDSAYLATVCFAMLSIVLAASTVAGTNIVIFLAPPNHGDFARDIAGGTALSYGLIALVAFFIFRARFWGIRGQEPEANDGEPGSPNSASSDQRPGHASVRPQ